LLRNLVVLRVAPEAEGLFEGPQEERQELIELASRTEPARLRRMFRALVREIEDLSWAPQPAAVLEMAVIRLATLPAGDDVAQLLTRLDQLERRLAAAGGGGGGTTGGRASGAAASGSTTGSRRAREPRGDGGSARAATERPTPGPMPAPSPTASLPEPPAAAPLHTAGSPSSQESADTPAASDTGGSPEAIFDRLRAAALESDRARFASLEGARLIALRGELIELGVDGSFHAQRLRERKDELETLAQRLFGRPLRIAIEIVRADGPEATSLDAREESRRRRQKALNSEPVNLALEVLEAEIVEIRPLGDIS